ncbi:MAG: hypothetical protein AAF202_12255, partial [Pseudomonadota bacterium]
QESSREDLRAILLRSQEAYNTTAEKHFEESHYNKTTYPALNTRQLRRLTELGQFGGNSLNALVQFASAQSCQIELKGMATTRPSSSNGRPSLSDAFRSLLRALTLSGN